MALDPDNTVCFCFHVPLRKIESFCQREKPKAASQISACLASGTGCGWCIPMLRRIHLRICGDYKPWWKQESLAEDATEYHSAERDATDDAVDPTAYAAGRQQYLSVTKRKPPEEKG